MSITNINTRRPPARSGDDSINNSILKLVADWKVLRAKQEIEWAQRELATSLGHDERVSLEFLDGMRHCEFVLCQLQPKNVMAARAMLGVAIAILAYEGVDPESVLANGPVLDIVRNVCAALGFVDDKTRTCAPLKSATD